jgi:hypothetical protein
MDLGIQELPYPELSGRHLDSRLRPRIKVPTRCLMIQISLIDTLKQLVRARNKPGSGNQVDSAVVKD